MNQIILCKQCKQLKDKELICDKCAFYISEYCSKCNEQSEETCNICKEARDFLERDDKRQASRERSTRNHIANISVEYAEGNGLTIKIGKDIVEQLINRIDNKKVWSAFNTLTIKQKNRFLAYYLDGLTLAQIAENEGVSIKNIFKSLRLSEKKLKKFLK